MDSTKVVITSKALDSLAQKLSEKPSDPSMWKVLIPLLIGAGLTLTVQIVLNWLKNRKDKSDKRRELISQGRAKTYLIAQLLKDLAMYKAHKQYYTRCYVVGLDKEDSYKKHYEKGQEQRKIEEKLDEKIAEYFEIVSEYHILSKKNDDFKSAYEEIFKYKHPKPNKFVKTTESDLVQELSQEEERLNGIYETELMTKFNKLQDTMTN